MNKLIIKLLRFFLKKHKYPTSTLICRQNGNVVFEIETNWYDENLEPVSIVREIHSDKLFSVRYKEMFDFREFTGDISRANTI